MRSRSATVTPVAPFESSASGAPEIVVVVGARVSCQVVGLKPPKMSMPSSAEVSVTGPGYAPCAIQIWRFAPDEFWISVTAREGVRTGAACVPGLLSLPPGETNTTAPGAPKFAVSVSVVAALNGPHGLAMPVQVPPLQLVSV